MQGINKLPYINCEKFIDIKNLKNMNLEICSGIALSEIKAGTYGPGVIEEEKFNNFLKIKSKMLTDVSANSYRWKSMDHNQQNIFSKLYFGLYNPSTVVYLRESKPNVNPLYAYVNKHDENYYGWTKNIDLFPNLKIWLDNLKGNIFKTYGRILFFIHEHDCELLKHRDGIMYQPHKNEFLWLNPMDIKKFYIFDEEKNIKHYVESSAAFFNDLDVHGGDKNNNMTWSLRIDGIFTEKFRKKIKIDKLNYY